MFCVLSTNTRRERLMSETVERSSLDLRYESYRLRNDAAEARLLASIAERGIEQPLSGVDTPQGRLLLDGFKRYRCAKKLGIECLPYVSLGEEEAAGIVSLMRVSKHKTLSILEQARFVVELLTMHDMSVADVAETIMSYYDSFDYMTKQRNMVWLGPTGCGKSGLATAFLLQAIDRGHRGYFVTFPELLHELFQSLADRSEGKVLKRYLSYDCLVIDEVGYVEVEAAQVGQFFTLMHKRHKKKTTLITSNLGFAEWGSFLHNLQLTSALIDRLTENCHTINMKNCKSLRDKLDEVDRGDL